MIEQNNHTSVYSINKEWIEASNQDWTKQDIEDLWKKFNVVYDGIGLFPVKVIPRQGYSPLVCIGYEDDSVITFDRDIYNTTKETAYNYRNAFDAYWIDSLIHQLQAVKEKIQSMNELAYSIADYMVDVGTEKTMSGNYHFEFEEINSKFGTNFPEDVDLLNAVVDAAYDREEVSELLTDEDFDFMFYLDYCGLDENGDPIVYD